PPGALACAGCHAAAPAGAAPPALLGRPAGELAQMMRDFRSGTLAGTIMPRLSRGFDEAEIEAIAQWLATQRAP
ncbi:MAG: cytochrome C, partial [Methylobacteriaceae bacterium]|nr:cytochrome C [Methylobacteriaceae bacterium]